MDKKLLEKAKQYAKIRYSISYIQSDGTKVVGQNFTAEHVSDFLKQLELWGCHDIHIVSCE